jgi:hypothetical protein
MSAKIINPEEVFVTALRNKVSITGDGFTALVNLVGINKGNSKPDLNAVYGFESSEAAKDGVLTVTYAIPNGVSVFINPVLNPDSRRTAKAIKYVSPSEDIQEVDVYFLRSSCNFEQTRGGFAYTQGSGLFTSPVDSDAQPGWIKITLDETEDSDYIKNLHFVTGDYNCEDKSFNVESHINFLRVVIKKNGSSNTRMRLN